MDSIAQKDFEQFCVANDVSPTNMKADFYIAGHIKGQQRVIEKACNFLCKICSESNGGHLKDGESCSFIREFKQAMKGGVDGKESNTI